MKEIFTLLCDFMLFRVCNLTIIAFYTYLNYRQRHLLPDLTYEKGNRPTGKPFCPPCAAIRFFYASAYCFSSEKM